MLQKLDIEFLDTAIKQQICMSECVFGEEEEGVGWVDKAVTAEWTIS